MSNNQIHLGSLAGGIALIFDRTSAIEESLSSAWLIGDNKVATVGSAVAPFSANPNALRVSFPKAGKECGVESIAFHPKFNRGLAREAIQRGMLLDSPEVALQKFNCAVLTIRQSLDPITEVDYAKLEPFMCLPAGQTKEGFSGSLKDIELPLVLQTVTNAKKEGILYLCDARDRPVAQLFCQAGRVISAKYKNLINESAVYQIVAKNVGEKFVFKNCGISNWLPAKPIAHSLDGLLIEAHRRLDELTKLKTESIGSNAYFVRAQRMLDIEQLYPEISDQAGNIWRVLDGQTPAEQLWHLVGYDDYTVYRVLNELTNRYQIRKVMDGGTRQIDIAAIQASLQAAPWTPLPLGLDLPLPPFDELTSIGVDPEPEAQPFNPAIVAADLAILPAPIKTRMKTGSLLGAIDSYDNLHLLHDIPLLPNACGIPIFKEGQVVGMHCGVVPSSPELENSTGILQQMIWVEGVMDCLKSGGEAKLVERLTMLDRALPRLDDAGSVIPAGCNQIAEITCPRCGEPTFDSARICKKCKLNLMPNTEYKEPPKVLNLALAVLAILLLSGASAAAIAWAALPQPDVQTPKIAALPPKKLADGESWVKLTTMKTADSTAVPIVWQPLPAVSEIKNDDYIHFKLESSKTSYVYLLYKGRWSKSASILYPSVGDKNNQLQKGAALHTGGFNVEPPAGRETVIAVASDKPLKWLDSPEQADWLFEYAAHYLGKDAQKGFVTTMKQIAAANTEALDGSKIDDSDTTVYFTAVTVNHK